MKKVGLMTCYMNNFGACLQAYALQSTIEHFGYPCEIIKYTPIRSLKEYNFLVTLALQMRSRLKSLHDPNYAYEIARKKNFDAFKKKYLKFGKAVYNEIEELYAKVPDYDVFVTGSDQIWNPMIHNGANNKAYFLDFVPQGRKRIAYAPSIGLTKLPAACEQEMGELIDRFDAVSVREADGKRIVDQISKKECRVVLDPTLLKTREDWLEMAPPPLVQEPYIFCYIFSDQDYIGNFIQYVQKQLGLKVVTIPFTKREYESDALKIKSAGPLEFLSLIQNAALILTDSFHATAFSVNLNVPFYSLLRNTPDEKNNMNSRIVNILDKVHLSERLIPNEAAFPTKVELQVDFTASNAILNAQRETDLQFLRDEIERQ